VGLVAGTHCGAGLFLGIGRSVLLYVPNQEDGGCGGVAALQPTPRDAAGNFTDFDVTTASGAIWFVAAINISGEVAGTYNDAAYVHHGFIRDAAGNITSFDDPYAGTKATQGTVVRCMNRYGATAGSYVAGGGKFHGFFRAGH